MNPESQVFILSTRRGLRAGIDDPARALLASLPIAGERGRSTRARLEVGDGIPLEIVDSVHRLGPRLVRLGNRRRDEIRHRVPELRLTPLVEYGPAVTTEYRPAVVSEHLPLEEATSSDGTWSVTVLGPDGRGVPGARILATDDEQGWRSRTTTDSSGTAYLDPPPSLAQISTLVAQPIAGLWGAYRANVSTRVPAALEVAAVDLATEDALSYYYGASVFDPDQGIRIGIVDEGVDEHRDLDLEGGCNTVIEESDSDHASASRHGHGTHVAGIVAAAADRPDGVRGVAPGACIRSYRVFPGDGWVATNYSIIKALIAAQIDGCDIVNLSLEASEDDPALADAVEDAREHGIVVVAAAGNGRDQPMRQPGSCPGAIAVAAFGRTGTFPSDSSAANHLSDLRGSDPTEFMAAFSKNGADVTCVAPGVGIVSTLPGNAYGPRSGTSVATAVVTGVIASLLSRNPEILSRSRDRGRTRAIERLLATSARPAGFGRLYEGLGRPTC